MNDIKNFLGEIIYYIITIVLYIIGIVDYIINNGDKHGKKL